MTETRIAKLNDIELDLRIEQAYKMLSPCKVCPRMCCADRLNDDVGVCGAGNDLMISSFGAHFGEEDVLVGSRGSGTLFLTGCNLRCVFCQNYDISQLNDGRRLSLEEFADTMIQLQNKGCHNINFVTPTHFTPQIMKGIKIAKGQGLDVPLVYNCGGYESVEMLRLLDGIIDIYMPDVKYADPVIAGRLSSAKDYPQVVKAALKEMHRQVGDLQVKDGLATQGLLVRHLVLPDGLAGTEELMRFIAEEISPGTYVNVMEQYRPEFKAASYAGINRRITREEWLEAVAIARRHGLPV